MRCQNRLGFFSIFKIRSLMINLVPDVLACKTTAENTAEKKILNRLIFCPFFFFPPCSAKDLLVKNQESLVGKVGKCFKLFVYWCFE